MPNYDLEMAESVIAAKDLEIDRLTTELKNANARERKAFMTACKIRSITPIAEWDEEEAWQQYRCQDDTDWKATKCPHPVHDNPGLIIPCPECGTD